MIICINFLFRPPNIRHDFLNWFRRINLNNYDHLFIPINLPGHWIFVVVHLKEYEINCYDSLCSHLRSDILSNILHFLKEQYECRNYNFDPSFWHLNSIICPQQQNNYDCGAFVCRFALNLSQNLNLQFDQVFIYRIISL